MLSATATVSDYFSFTFFGKTTEIFPVYSLTVAQIDTNQNVSKLTL